MRRKIYWYRTNTPHDSGIYWVDFCFHWFRVMVKTRVVKEIVFKKRLRLQPWHRDKDLCRGFWDEFERKIYLNSSKRNIDFTRKHVPLPRTLIHELYHILDPAALEPYVRYVVELELWELASDAQRKFLYRYIRKQWIRQFGEQKKRKSRRGRSRLLFFPTQSIINA